MTTNTPAPIGQNNPYAPVAGTLAASTVAFIAANRESDNASTPFSRSLLATLVGGLSSLAMAETLVIAAMGSPKSPSTGKAVKNVSGLRNVEGGARLYQAWKDVTLLIENIDADAYLVAPGSDEALPLGVPGKAAIRPAIVAFILSEGDVKSLFGAKGITATVKRMMAEHATALAALHGIVPDAANDAAESTDDAKADYMDLGKRAAALLVAINAATDDDFIDHSTALAALADAITARWDAIEAANPPVTDEAPAPVKKAA